MQTMHGKEDTLKRETNTEGNEGHPNTVKLHIII
jgi:hypothetical protein